MLEQLRSLISNKTEGALEQVQDLAEGDLYDVMESPIMNASVENPDDDGLYAIAKRFLWDRVVRKIPLVGTGIGIANWMSDRWKNMSPEQRDKVNTLYLKLIGRQHGPITFNDIPNLLEGNTEKLSMLDELRAKR